MSRQFTTKRSLQADRERLAQSYYEEMREHLIVSKALEFALGRFVIVHPASDKFSLPTVADFDVARAADAAASNKAIKPSDVVLVSLHRLHFLLGLSLAVGLNESALKVMGIDNRIIRKFDSAIQKYVGNFDMSERSLFSHVKQELLMKGVNLNALVEHKEQVEYCYKNIQHYMGGALLQCSAADLALLAVGLDQLVEGELSDSEQREINACRERLSRAMLWHLGRAFDSQNPNPGFSCYPADYLANQFRNIPAFEMPAWASLGSVAPQHNLTVSLALPEAGTTYLVREVVNDIPNKSILSIFVAHINRHQPVGEQFVSLSQVLNTAYSVKESQLARFISAGPNATNNHELALLELQLRQLQIIVKRIEEKLNAVAPFDAMLKVLLAQLARQQRLIEAQLIVVGMKNGHVERALNQQYAAIMDRLGEQLDREQTAARELSFALPMGSDDFKEMMDLLPSSWRSQLSKKFSMLRVFMNALISRRSEFLVEIKSGDRRVLHSFYLSESFQKLEKYCIDYACSASEKAAIQTIAALLRCRVKCESLSPFADVYHDWLNSNQLADKFFKVEARQSDVYQIAKAIEMLESRVTFQDQLFDRKALVSMLVKDLLVPLRVPNALCNFISKNDKMSSSVPAFNAIICLLEKHVRGDINRPDAAHLLNWVLERDRSGVKAKIILKFMRDAKWDGRNPYPHHDFLKILCEREFSEGQLEGLEAFLRAIAKKRAAVYRRSFNKDRKLPCYQDNGEVAPADHFLFTVQPDAVFDLIDDILCFFDGSNVWDKNIFLQHKALGAFVVRFGKPEQVASYFVGVMYHADLVIAQNDSNESVLKALYRDAQSRLAQYQAGDSELERKLTDALAEKIAAYLLSQLSQEPRQLGVCIEWWQKKIASIKQFAGSEFLIAESLQDSVTERLLQALKHHGKFIAYKNLIQFFVMDNQLNEASSLFKSMFTSKEAFFDESLDDQVQAVFALDDKISKAFFRENVMTIIGECDENYAQKTLLRLAIFTDINSQHLGIAYEKMIRVRALALKKMIEASGSQNLLKLLRSFDRAHAKINLEKLLFVNGGDFSKVQALYASSANSMNNLIFLNWCLTKQSGKQLDQSLEQAFEHAAVQWWISFLCGEADINFSDARLKDKVLRVISKKMDRYRSDLSGGLRDDVFGESNFPRLMKAMGASRLSIWRFSKDIRKIYFKYVEGLSSMSAEPVVNTLVKLSDFYGNYKLDNSYAAQIQPLVKSVFDHLNGCEGDVLANFDERLEALQAIVKGWVLDAGSDLDGLQLCLRMLAQNLRGLNATFIERNDRWKRFVFSLQELHRVNGLYKEYESVFEKNVIESFASTLDLSTLLLDLDAMSLGLGQAQISLLCEKVDSAVVYPEAVRKAIKDVLLGSVHEYQSAKEVLSTFVEQQKSAEAVYVDFIRMLDEADNFDHLEVDSLIGQYPYLSDKSKNMLDKRMHDLLEKQVVSEGGQDRRYELKSLYPLYKMLLSASSKRVTQAMRLDRSGLFSGERKAHFEHAYDLLLLIYADEKNKVFSAKQSVLETSQRSAARFVRQSEFEKAKIELEFLQDVCGDNIQLPVFFEDLQKIPVYHRKTSNIGGGVKDAKRAVSECKDTLLESVQSKLSEVFSYPGFSALLNGVGELTFDLDEEILARKHLKIFGFETDAYKKYQVARKLHALLKDLKKPENDAQAILREMIGIMSDITQVAERRRLGNGFGIFASLKNFVSRLSGGKSAPKYDFNSSDFKARASVSAEAIRSLAEMMNGDAVSTSGGDHKIIINSRQVLQWANVVISAVISGELSLDDEASLQSLKDNLIYLSKEKFAELEEALRRFVGGLNAVGGDGLFAAVKDLLRAPELSEVNKLLLAKIEMLSSKSVSSGLEESLPAAAASSALPSSSSTSDVPENRQPEVHGDSQESLDEASSYPQRKPAKVRMFTAASPGSTLRQGDDDDSVANMQADSEGESSFYSRMTRYSGFSDLSSRLSGFSEMSAGMFGNLAWSPGSASSSEVSASPEKVGDDLLLGLKRQLRSALHSIINSAEFKEGLRTSDGANLALPKRSKEFLEENNDYLCPVSSGGYLSLLWSTAPSFDSSYQRYEKACDIQEILNEVGALEKLPSLSQWTAYIGRLWSKIISWKDMGGDFDESAESKLSQCHQEIAILLKQGATSEMCTAAASRAH